MTQLAQILRGLALVSGALIAACNRERPGNPAQTASTYTSDADSDATDNAREGTRQGRSHEAPPKVAGLRVQLQQLRAGTSAPENLTAYKFALADLVSSMEADLMRVSAAGDAAHIRQMGDSLLDALGGGTGPARQLNPDELRAHTEAVDRMIREYEAGVSRR